VSLFFGRPHPSFQRSQTLKRIVADRLIPKDCRESLIVENGAYQDGPSKKLGPPTVPPPSLQSLSTRRKRPMSLRALTRPIFDFAASFPELNSRSAVASSLRFCSSLHFYPLQSSYSFLNYVSLRCFSFLDRFCPFDYYQVGSQLIASFLEHRHSPDLSSLQTLLGGGEFKIKFSRNFNNIKKHTSMLS
jgi:hypothetical protein